MTEILIGLGLIWGCGYLYTILSSDHKETNKRRDDLLRSYYSTWYFTGAVVAKLQNIDEYYTEDILYEKYKLSRDRYDFIQKMTSGFTMYATLRADRDPGAWG